MDKKKGFTLIEVLVALILISMLYLGIIPLFSSYTTMSTQYTITMMDNWKQYNSIIDSIYNRNSLPTYTTTGALSSVTAIAIQSKLNTISTMEEKIYIANTLQTDVNNSIALQSISVTATLNNGKKIVYDIYGVLPYNNMYKQVGNNIVTPHINIFTRETHIWTLAQNNTWLYRQGTYFPNYSDIDSITYIAFNTPVNISTKIDGVIQSDTMRYSTFYYVGDMKFPYVVGYDTQRRGAPSIAPSDAIGYPQLISRQMKADTVDYKTNEFPGILLRQALYYAGIAVHYTAPQKGQAGWVTIAGYDVPVTPLTIWGDRMGSQPVFRYSYYKNGDGSLDIQRSANKITANGWIPNYDTIFLTSDIIELAFKNVNSGNYVYGRSLVPTNILYELSNGKLSAEVMGNMNIVVNMRNNFANITVQNNNVKPKVERSFQDKISLSYTYPWSPPQACNAGTVEKKDTQTINNVVTLNNALLKQLYLKITVAPEGAFQKNYSNSGSCVVTTCQYDKDGNPYNCKDDTYNWNINETLTTDIVTVKVNKVVAHTPWKDITWNTDTQLTFNIINGQPNTQYMTLTLTGDKDPAKLLSWDPDMVSIIWNKDTEPKNWQIKYDMELSIDGKAGVWVSCWQAQCHVVSIANDGIPFSSMAQGFKVTIEPQMDNENTLYVPFTRINLPFTANVGVDAVKNDNWYIYYMGKQNNTWTGWYATESPDALNKSEGMYRIAIANNGYAISDNTYISDSYKQVRNNIDGKDSIVAIFKGYAPIIRLTGTPKNVTPQAIMFSKQPMTWKNIQDTQITFRAYNQGGVP